MVVPARSCCSSCWVGSWGNVTQYSCTTQAQQQLVHMMLRSTQGSGRVIHRHTNIGKFWTLFWVIPVGSTDTTWIRAIRTSAQYSDMICLIL
jgi:hypothetical protein